LASAERRIIELEEYSSRRLPRHELSDEVAQVLHRDFSRQVAVQPPSFLNGHEWELAGLGFVGFIPVTSELGLQLKPKVEIRNLFRMLEVAYSLREFTIFDDLFDAKSLAEFYEHLAIVLSKRVMDRCRKGIYAQYLAQDEALPYVRGQVNLQPWLRTPWRVEIPCHFEEHTADIEDNQLLGWTLQRILHSGRCTEARSLPTVRRAYHALRQTVTLQPYGALSCINRLYNRLNADYHPMHALCFFFLDHSGPSHELGDHKMLPFLIDMAGLFERFVAEWLRCNLADRYLVKAQDNYTIDPGAGLHFKIDLVVEERRSGQVRWVMDTKYKAPPGGPAASDIQQVVAYAEAKEATEAILIYPTLLTSPLNSRVGNVRVRTLTFSLDGDLDLAGQRFLQTLAPR
jgi:5-methylcytosine-specific restriction enzyme subunit McrC